MKRILFLMVLSMSVMFASINLNTASKSELMKINGIGAKKADAIMKYRKMNTIKSADDLSNIKGFGKSTINNVKSGKTSKVKKMDNVKVMKSKKTKKPDLSKKAKAMKAKKAKAKKKMKLKI